MTQDNSAVEPAAASEIAAQTRRRVEVLRLLRGQSRPVPLWIEIFTAALCLLVFWLALRDGLSHGLTIAIGSMTVGLGTCLIHQARAIKRLDAAIELLLEIDRRSSPRD
ncbi:hypothetical protein IP84_00845 [beta proteobacterium AAP99]|nr:hypothetical protein IP84_00845 [beta proteobacterium AAP99]